MSDRGSGWDNETPLPNGKFKLTPEQQARADANDARRRAIAAAARRDAEKQAR